MPLDSTPQKFPKLTPRQVTVLRKLAEPEVTLNRYPRFIGHGEDFYLVGGNSVHRSTAIRLIGVGYVDERVTVNRSGQCQRHSITELGRKALEALGE